MLMASFQQNSGDPKGSSVASILAALEKDEIMAGLRVALRRGISIG